jgi:hypothetical protein
VSTTQLEKARAALDLVRTILLADVDAQIRQELAIARKRLEVELQGADFFRGYTLNVSNVTTPQNFNVDKITIPVKLMGLTVVTPSGGNPADTLTFQIQGETTQDYLDVPVNAVPVGSVDARFRFRRGHPIPPFKQIVAVWINSVAVAKTVVIGAAYVRDQGQIDRV